MPVAPDAAVAALHDALTGPIFSRGEEGYQGEIDGFNSLSPMAPDYVVGAADERDVQTAVRFARSRASRSSSRRPGTGPTAGSSTGS